MIIYEKMILVFGGSWNAMFEKRELLGFDLENKIWHLLEDDNKTCINLFTQNTETPAITKKFQLNLQKIESPSKVRFDNTSDSAKDK